MAACRRHHSATQHDPKQQWQPVTVTCHEAQNPMQTPIITNSHLSERQTMSRDTANTVSATAKRWEQWGAREWGRKDKTERTNNRSDVTRIHRRGKTWGWGGWDDESGRKRQRKWAKRQPWENDQRDRQSLVRVDSAAVSWRCQLVSGDVFSRHWLLRTWPLCVEPEQTKCSEGGGGER